MAHAANSQQGNEAAGHVHGSNVRQRQKTLRTWTLAEEASLQDAKVARAKAKAEALARAQLLASQDDDDEETFVEGDSDLKDAEAIHKTREEARRRRPLMPLKKLAEKGKADRQAREQEVSEEIESLPALEVRVPAPAIHMQEVLLADDSMGGQQDLDQAASEQDETELAGIIAKLRQEALDRRLRKIHRAQRDAKGSPQDDSTLNKVKERGIDDETRLRRPGIVKSRKVSTKED